MGPVSIIGEGKGKRLVIRVNCEGLALDMVSEIADCLVDGQELPIESAVFLLRSQQLL